MIGVVQRGPDVKPSFDRSRINDDRGSFVCFYCKKSGHIKKDCPELKKIRCFNCGLFGHLSRVCRQSNRSGNDDRAGQ